MHPERLTDLYADAVDASPGPWYLAERLHDEMFAAVFGSDGHLVVNLGDGGNGLVRQTANANLIVAVPELLAHIREQEAEIRKLTRQNEELVRSREVWVREAQRYAGVLALWAKERDEQDAQKACPSG